MASAEDHGHMAEALRLAANGQYDTAPNPAVGCVLVKGDRVVGKGWTAPAGGPHAERVARTVTMSWHPDGWGEDSPWARMFQNARKWVG